MSTISASTTSTTAYKVTADTTGALVFQTGATPTTAMTLGSDQSVTFAGTPTYSAGTANGVAYLNGSKVLTTGSALVFDGSNLGLGVTPSAWRSTWKALQIGARASYISGTAGQPIISYNSYQNTSNQWIYLASGVLASNYEQSDGAHYWYNAPSGTAGDAISFTQAMTLDASGNLLLGGTSNASNARMLSENATGNQLALRYTGIATWYNSIDSSGNYIWTKDGSEKARIASGGQFCVNTTNTNGAFNVSGNVYLFSQSAGAGTHFLKWNSGTGQVTYDSSSRLVKDNIIDSPYGLAEVMQLKSRKYLRIDDQRDEIGLIADEVQAVMPEFVPMSQKSIFTKNEEDTELVPSGVYYEKLSSVLIKAIQEQQALITTLKAELDTAKADIATLKGAA